MAVEEEGEEDEEGQDEGQEDSGICALGSHEWKEEQCLICSVCGHCTGYGEGCCNNDGRPGRDPGK